MAALLRISDRQSTAKNPNAGMLHVFISHPYPVAEEHPASARSVSSVSGVLA